MDFTNMMHKHDDSNKFSDKNVYEAIIFLTCDDN